MNQSEKCECDCNCGRDSYDPGNGVVSSPALCAPCLFGPDVDCTFYEE